MNEKARVSSDAIDKSEVAECRDGKSSRRNEEAKTRGGRGDS